MRYEIYRRDEHYPHLEVLWRRRGWLPPPPEFLPPTGYVFVTPEGVAAALFIYIVPGCGAWVDWAIADPELPQERRRTAMRHLFCLCENLARKEGARFLYSTTQSQAFRALLLECGMVVAEEKTTTFCKHLKGDNTAMTFIMDYDSTGEGGCYAV